jgi:hypothetical protein
MILRPSGEKQPRTLDHVALELSAAHTPRQRVGDSPPSHALAVEPEIRGKNVEATTDSSRIPGPAEQPSPVAQKRRGVELALTDERLRIDR